MTRRLVGAVQWVLVGIASFWLSPNVAHCYCYCSEPVASRATFDRVEMVFEARVVVGPTVRQLRYRLPFWTAQGQGTFLSLEVQRVFKGEVPRRLLIAYDQFGGLCSCGAPRVKEGEVRIFFLHRPVVMPILGVCGHAPQAAKRLEEEAHPREGLRAGDWLGSGAVDTFGATGIGTMSAAEEVGSWAPARLPREGACESGVCEGPDGVLDVKLEVPVKDTRSLYRTMETLRAASSMLERLPSDFWPSAWTRKREDGPGEGR